MMKKQLTHKQTVILASVVTVVFGGILYYLMLPAVNIKSVGFWFYILAMAICFSVVYYSGSIAIVQRQKFQNKLFRNRTPGVSETPVQKVSDIPIFWIIGLGAIMILISFFGSSKLFHARAYSRIITVEDGSVEDLPSVSGTDSIALMDTASAEKLGNREIGTLSNVVSQYDVSDYTQIDYKGTPVKVSPLMYAGFFKWNSNRENGIPGYVIVDPVSMDADYIAMEEGMIYVPSGYLSEDLKRHIRFAYPTAMFGNLHFEIDEEGNPWYVASVYDHKVGLFGGTQVIGSILVNPIDGSMEMVDTGDVPKWVDVVFPGNLICEQYNNSAQLHNGFWNSLIGQNGCRKITEYNSADDDEESYSDYGYISKDGDIWIYTGVTSVNNDSSNIGFILSNERTAETLFITCAGADEFSAMASAEGEVQEKGYQASFPSLILMDDKPTYIMVLKDASGLVKMYAAVNVEQYNMVATASTQNDCLEKYAALAAGKISQEEATNEGTTVLTEADSSDYKEKEIVIQKMETIVENGDTYLYIVDKDNTIYHARYTDVIDMILCKEGDTVKILTDGSHFLLPEKEEADKA